MDTHDAGRVAQRLIYELPKDKEQALEEKNLERWVSLIEEQRQLDDELKRWIETHSV